MLDKIQDLDMFRDPGDLERWEGQKMKALMCLHFSVCAFYSSLMNKCIKNQENLVKMMVFEIIMPEGPRRAKPRAGSKESASHHVKTNPTPLPHTPLTRGVPLARAALMIFGSWDVIFGVFIIDFLIFGKWKNNDATMVGDALGGVWNRF